MEHLKLAWVYRFWIVVGIVALMPIISWWVDTRKLATNAEREANTLKGIVKGLEDAAKSPNPNDEWANAVTLLKDELYGKVGVAHVNLYKKQVEFMTWPKEVKEAYVAAGEKSEVDLDVKLKYQEIFDTQFTDLIKLVQPVDSAGIGKVQMNPAVIYPKFSKPWARVGELLPTAPEAALAQEDIWLVRSMLGVVARANAKSSKVEDANVKEILEIEIGAAALDDTIANSKTPKEQLSPRGETPAAAGTSGKVDGREIKGQLYTQIPVSMRLIIYQPNLGKILAEFANSEIPMLVKQVQFSEVSLAERNNARLSALLGASAKKADTKQKFGSAQPKDDTYFQMAEIEVRARAILYTKPESVKQEEAAAEKAKAEQPKPPQAGG
jgi:hypothetical protein